MNPRTAMAPSSLASVLAASLIASVAGSGCHIISGYDDFTDETAGGAGGAGGGTTSAANGCPSCTGDVIWSRQFGGSGDQVAVASTDATGHVLVGCRFAGTFGFDAFEVPSLGAEGLDGCAAELDASGNAVWARGFGATRTGESHAPPIALASGDVIVSSSFEGVISFDGLELQGFDGLDIGYARFDTAGAALWTNGFPAEPGDQQIIAVAADGDGFVATGAFDGTLGGLMTAGAYDVWIGRFDANGQPTLLRNFGGAGYDSAYGIAPTADGGVVFVGGFEGSIDFGGGPLVSAGSFDGFVVKLDAAGNHVWSKRFGDADGFLQLGLAVDQSNDDVVIVLGTTQAVDFGGGALPPAGGSDVVVTRLDAAGGHRWTKRWGDAAEQSGVSVAAAGGFTLVAGDFEGTLDAGGGPLASAGGRDVFVAKLDAAGEHVWSKRFGDGASQTLGSVAVDRDGNVVLTGAFAGTLDLGAGPLTSVDALDIFVAKLAP